MNRSSRIQRANIPAQNTRLPLIGKVRIGEKRTNSGGKEYPVSLDYFIATGSYAAKFDEVYQKPDRIQIVFISDDDFQSCYEEWDGRDKDGRRAGYGDGETYWLWQYGKDCYEPTTDKQIVTAFSKQHTVKWRQVLTINFVLPAIKGVFGVWQLQTGGDKSSINAIRDTFDAIKEQAGTIVNIPFDLCVKKVTSNKPEAKSVYPVISLVPNLSVENMEQLRAFFEAGIDVKRQGILTDNKLAALQAHPSDAAEHADAPVYTGVITSNADEVINEAKHSGRTVLDAAANTAKDDDHERKVQSLSRTIKQCKTVEQCQELYSTEPMLFAGDDARLSTLLTDRINELKSPA
jgi:hypothetical protein